MNVFTDGACSHNGRPNAKAGIGIYVGPQDPRNVSQRISGKQTNNTAELKAIIGVFHILTDERETTDIQIYTDSEYAIKCAGSYGAKCQKKGWTKRIPNHPLVQEIYELFQTYPRVQLTHVRAHTGLSDELSLGNAEADRLATTSLRS